MDGISSGMEISGREGGVSCEEIEEDFGEKNTYVEKKFIYYEWWYNQLFRGRTIMDN